MPHLVDNYQFGSRAHNSARKNSTRTTKSTRRISSKSSDRLAAVNFLPSHAARVLMQFNNKSYMVIGHDGPVYYENSRRVNNE